MELKPGYKLTEVGVIPEDWEDVRLGEIAEIRMCKRVFHQQTTATGEIPFFKIGTFGKEPDAFISSSLYQDYKKKYSFPQKGDILLSAAGTLGRTVVYGGEDAYFQDSNIVWLDVDKGKISNEYLYYCYQTIKWASPEGSTISRLYNGIIKSTKIALPPTIEEQRAIAQALSDVDALLAAQEQLIAKKRDLKQAAMQQLLTGKTRLPGFSGEWAEKKLGDLITHCSSGATPRRNRPEFFKGDIKWITSGELNYNTITDTIEKISREAVEETNLTIHPTGTFLMAITGLEAEGTRGACGIIGSPATTNQSCMAVFPTSELATEYLFHYYIFKGKTLALQYCQGTKQQSYTAGIVKQLPIKLPPTRDEQIAIASALFDMDAEISALEARREKTRAIKQAMMQELLTGKTRLIATA